MIRKGDFFPPSLFPLQISQLICFLTDSHHPAEKKGGPCRWFSETDDVENIIRPGAHGIRKIIPQADEHPTPKPVELALHFIKLHSREGELILDPFFGRGSTAIASIRSNRRFIGVEVDGHWFTKAVERISEALAMPLFDQPKTEFQSSLWE